MTGSVLERSLNSVIRRLQKLRVLRRQAYCWLFLLIPAIAVTLWLPGRVGIVGSEIPVVLATTIIGIFLARAFVRNPSKTEAARLIEQADPELNDAILTAVQVADRSGFRPSVLAAMAIQEADKLARQGDWSVVVPSRQMMKWTVLSFLSFVVMVSSVMAASRYGRDLVKPVSDTTLSSGSKAAATLVTELVIEPGDTEIEQGAALTVVARFPGVVPVRAVLEFIDKKNTVRQMAMTETVDAGVFAARMEEIAGDGMYRVLYEEAQAKSDKPLISPSFIVRTYIRPKLDHVDAVITPPAWSRQPQEIVEDVMRLSATEGSTVTLQLYLNKPVAMAELRPNDGGTPVVLTASSQDTAMMEASMLLTESNTWTVYLQDAEGRTPADEEKISIKVTFNEPPNIKVTFPGRDTNVSPLQEFLVEAKASDDFELVNFGVQYSLSGGELKDASLMQKTPEPQTDPRPDSAVQTATLPIRNADISYQIELESLNAAPDDLVTYSFWAGDIAPDGSERRSYSDIMFAEVRRFEEIFRESQQGDQQQQQQQQQGQQQQGSAVDGVLQLQKEIISATWNTIRTEAASQRNGSFTQDVETIAESQGQAIQQLEAAVEELAGEPKTAALAERAMEQMTAAQQKLEAIQDGSEGARLLDAMPIEQSIVGTLLKMRAAEFQVRQQQQQGGGGGGGGGNSASQQQLQQLELDNKRNRYESEQQARQQQERTQQQREQLHVLNRLKELARRQQMVNERLKQLESELRAATTEKERQEIERELKRLRDEQREMLRDVDELAERMDQATDQQNPQSSQMKQQMDQARNNVQQASRAMDEGRLAEAISEGTRAERQFEDLKEEFRNQTSSKFEEAVRDLRDQAKELSEQQEELARQLSGETPDDAKDKRPSLRSERDRNQLQKDVGQQRDRLNRVVEQTKQMIEQAEQSEPLLSNKLYDTLRDLKDSKPEEALEATEFLAGRGMWSQSQQAEQVARKGIEQLRDGIEKAADSVLGSEAESLRRAQAELEDATKKLASEVRSATGADPAEERRPGQRGQQRQQENAPGANAEQTTVAASNDTKTGEPGQSRRPGQRGEEKDEGKGSAESKSGDQSGSKQPSGGKSGETGEPQPGQNEGDAELKAQQSTDSAQTGQPGQKGQSGQKSEQPGQKSASGQKGSGGQQSGEQPGQNSAKGGGQSQDGQPGSGEPQAGQPNPSPSGQPQSESSPSGRPQGQRQQPALMQGGREGNGGGGANNASSRPLTGDDFTKWSDQLRDIEEMLEDPELRNRVAQVRDRARAMRAEFKRHGEMPQWDLVKSQLLSEMQSLQQRIDQEVAKLESDRAMVPIDREPVPQEFDALVQRYYELLGQERGADEP